MVGSGKRGGHERFECWEAGTARREEGYIGNFGFHERAVGTVRQPIAAIG